MSVGFNSQYLPDIKIPGQIAETPQPSPHQSKPESSGEFSTMPPSPPVPKEVELANQLANWVKIRAQMLHQLEKGNLHSGHCGKGSLVDTQTNADALAVNPAESPMLWLNEAIDANSQAVKLADALGSLGAPANALALEGLGYANMVGNDLTAGLHFAVSKYQERCLEAEIKTIEDLLSKLPPNSSQKTILAAQKQRFEDRLEKQKESSNQSCKSFLGTHWTNTLMAVLKILGFSKDAGATTAMFAGGAAFSGLGLIANTVGVFMNTKKHLNADEQLAKIERISQEHDNSKVSSAISAIKTSAVDQIANHEKANIKLGIFQNIFAIGQNAITFAVTVTAAVLGVASIGSMGLAIPICVGIGLIIAGGIAIYKLRHTIARSLKGLFKNRANSSRGALSLERNLTFRQWRRESKLKSKIQKLDTLGQQWVTAKGSEQDRLHRKIDKNAKKVIAIKKEIEEIRYKKAKQSLRDNTGSLENAQKSREEALGFALTDIVSELKQVKDNIAALEKDISSGSSNNYKELTTPLLEKSRKKLLEVKAELKKLENPSEELMNQFEALARKKLEAKKSVEASPKSIKEKSAVSTGALTEIENEKKRLRSMQKSISEDIFKIENPTHETITEFKGMLQKKLESLKQEGKNLTNREDAKSSESALKPSSSSAEALDQTLDNLTEEELLTQFLPECRKAFPGIQFNDLNTAQNKKMYIKTQVQTAIASNQLF